MIFVDLLEHVLISTKKPFSQGIPMFVNSELWDFDFWYFIH